MGTSEPKLFISDNIKHKVRRQDKKLIKCKKYTLIFEFEIPDLNY